MLTLVLPLGLFVVVMIGMSVVFGRPGTVPGRRLAQDRSVPPTGDRAREDRQPEDEDTAVSDTIVGDTAGGGGARDSAAGELAGGDTPSGDTAVGDNAGTDTPQAPE